MLREVFWVPTNGPGGEHLRFIEDSAGVTAESVVLGVNDERPFRISYEVSLDSEYRVRQVRIATLGWDSESLLLRADGEGQWTDGNGEALSTLEGCIDVDISATPFSNTLPIRRFDLDRNESVEVSVVYVTVPELDVEVAAQRYTCLDPIDEDGGRYRYESVSSGFSVELSVDADGLVVTYPELFDRVAFP